MKYQIVNYWFDFNGKRHWFVDYDDAVNAAARVMNLNVENLKEEIIYHIVKEYEIYK
jgi:hypothetical protein